MTWPRLYLWPSIFGIGKRLAPDLRDVLGCLRLDLREHGRVDADIGHPHVAAVDPAGQQQMRRLAPEEGDGLDRADRNPHHGTAGAVDAAGQVDGENRGAVGVDRLDHVVRLAGDGPVQTGAEQGIDDQRRLADRLRVERQHRIFPALCRQRRIALQAVPLAQQDDRHVAATCRQFGRRDKAVPAIVAGARDHQDRPLLHELHRGFRNRLARAHHQREARRPRGDGEPVGALHFSGGQNFHAKSLVQAPDPEAFPVPREAQTLASAYEPINLPIS